MQEQDPNKFAALVVTFLETLLVLGVSMGWFQLSQEQIQLWVNLAIAGAALLIPIIGFMWARNRVTPLAAPKDVDGTPLVRRDGSAPMRSIEIAKIQNAKS